MTENTTTTIADRAREIGADHGRARASWYFDGNTPAEAYPRVLAGIEDGDPQVLDTFPQPDLGGEWADSYTSRDLCAELEIDEAGDDADEACEAYLEGFCDTVVDEIAATARRMTS